MRLEEYVSRQGRGGISRLAQKVGRTPSAVRKWCLPEGDPHKKYPDRSSVVALYVATAGAVPPNDLFDLPTLSAEAAP